MGKLLNTSEEAKVAFGMMMSSSRSKHPALVVEGKGDFDVLSKFRSRRGNLDIIPIEYNPNSVVANKDIVLDVVSEHAKQHPELVRGLVDVDYDCISEILLNEQSSESRYGENIVDTSPHTDFDLIVLEKIGVKNGIQHVRNISSEQRDEREALALEMAQWMGSIRIMKRMWERENDSVLYLKLNDLRELCKSKPPKNIDSMIDYLSNSKLPLSATQMKSKVQAILENINRLQIPWYQYVNGHDLANCLAGVFQENHFKIGKFKWEPRIQINYSHVQSHPLFQTIDEWRKSQGFQPFFAKD